jgi:hypothetical protein
VQRRKMLFQLLLVWLLASVIIAGYAWLYIQQRGMPPWVDVSFITIVVLVLTRWTGQLPIELASSLSERAAGWPAPMMVNSWAWLENSKRLITQLLCTKR